MGRGRSSRTIELVETAREILEEIQPTSVRSVCYQLFNRRLLESMAKSETNRVSIALTRARKEGIIPWEWIVDESRSTEYAGTWDSPEQFSGAMENGFRLDRWNNQSVRVEVWSEKGTVRGMVAPVLRKYLVDFRVMHGFGSTTVLHEVAVMAKEMRQVLHVCYIGDWDPSGLFISDSDIPSRLREYGAQVQVIRSDDIGPADVYLERVALAEQDCTKDLSWFPAASKKDDKRYPWYLDHTHDRKRCWELDAMDPRDLRDRLAASIERFIDPDAWHRTALTEQAQRVSLHKVLEQWPGISRQASE